MHAIQNKLVIFAIISSEQFTHHQNSTNMNQQEDTNKILVSYQKVNIYQADTLVLNDVSFHVSEGEFIYIIGKVGSGKSSLLKTMYGELDIDAETASQAEVLGRDMIHIKRKMIPRLRREMGIIFQDFQLLNDRSIYKNLKFVLRATGWNNKKDMNLRINEVLTAVNMLEQKEKMPHELSGGEQQRIAIARALLNHPKIIIADEPTGNLDSETANSIIQLLKNITQTGTAVVMSTHNIPLLDKFPGIVYQAQEGCLREITNAYNKTDIAQDAETEADEDRKGL